MTDDVIAIDISDLPDLLHLAERVRESNEPCVLRRNHEDLAVLMPMPVKSRRSTKKSVKSADYEAFLAAAGSWKDVDVERFVEENAAQRARSSRPPVEL
jgi:hypothetical protein